MADTILITGGCGFIGTNFVRHMLERYDYTIINLDKLTYAGNRGPARAEVRSSIMVGERQDGKCRGLL